MGPQPVRPHQLKRQASELKSMYPLTKWCAVYINTKGSNPSNEWDEVDITSKIPETNVYLPMDLEENITMEVQMQIDEEKELKNKLSRQKQEIQASKQKKASAENDKIDTFMTSLRSRTETELDSYWSRMIGIYRKQRLNNSVHRRM